MTATNDSSSARRRTLNSPGLTARSHRIAELEHLLRLEEAKEQPDATPAEINNNAEARFRKLTTQNPGVIKQFKRYAQTSVAPNRRDINAWVELAAALNEPQVREVMSRLQSHSRGRRTDRREALAALTVLAGMPSSTSICHTTTMLRDAPIARWVFGDPPRLSRSSIYELLHGIADRHDPAIAVQANLALVQRLRERHPRIGTVAIVDGSKIEAHVVQRSPIDERHRQLLHNGRQRNVTSFLYTGSDNHVKNYWVGYKLMLLADRASGLPLTWNFDGADERTGSRGLLETLFTHWPDAPLEYLIGDGLYGRDRQYLHDLEFRWGVHPVFPLVESDISRAMPHATTRGVPECRHGLMKRRDHDGYTTPEHRRQQGIPRNHLVDDNARIRYVCSIGDPTCPRQSVYTRDDGRLYPYLPHAGLEGDQCFDRRQALLLIRNLIEMRFAHLKGGGVGNTGQARFKMRSDRVSEWLISLNLLLTSAKRVAYETGRYEEALDDARSLHLAD